MNALTVAFNVLTQTQEVYELAFAKGGMTTPFHIYCMSDRHVIVQHAFSVN